MSSKKITGKGVVTISQAVEITGYSRGRLGEFCRAGKFPGAVKNPQNGWWEIPVNEVLKIIKPGHTPPIDL